jgi:16S rRNA (adenine1518-N6/adenine1519-N6)-dimethyltransferase
LRKKYDERPSSEIWVEEGDIRTYDFSSMPEPYKIVANIPYYLTANLLRILADTPHKPTVAALLVQKEVAERIAAKPGEMGLTSVIAQYYFEVRLGREVPAHLFTPPPKIDSQILILRTRPVPLFGEIDERLLFRIVRAGFAARRKTLLNSLGGGLRLEKVQIQELLKSASIEPSRRAQTLSLDEWFALYQAYRT